MTKQDSGEAHVTHRNTYMLYNFRQSESPSHDDLKSAYSATVLRNRKKVWDSMRYCIMWEHILISKCPI